MLLIMASGMVPSALPASVAAATIAPRIPYVAATALPPFKNLDAVTAEQNCTISVRAAIQPPNKPTTVPILFPVFVFL